MAGFEDIALRAHRVRCLIKSVKLRGITCKKAPFNTDLLRWLHPQLVIGTTQSNCAPLNQLWCGLLVACFFCLGISELLALTSGISRLRRPIKEMPYQF